MVAALLILLLTFTSAQTANGISDVQKKEFIEVLKTLSVKGEFYTDEAIARAKPFMRVLFALTESDLAGYDIYPFLALSRGLSEHKETRSYAVRHFAEIQHPILKLGWGVMLFDAKVASPQVVQYLREASKPGKQVELLAEMLGPNYADFQRRLKAHRSAK